MTKLYTFCTSIWYVHLSKKENLRCNNFQFKWITMTSLYFLMNIYWTTLSSYKQTGWYWIQYTSANDSSNMQKHQMKREKINDASNRIVLHFYRKIENLCDVDMRWENPYNFQYCSISSYTGVRSVNKTLIYNGIKLTTLQ